jgi:hypothetical protein
MRIEYLAPRTGGFLDRCQAHSAAVVPLRPQRVALNALNGTSRPLVPFSVHQVVVLS